MSDAERAASLSLTLQDWNRRDPIWVFAYGSLIWRPEFDYDRKQRGVIYGFHRSLCLWSQIHRGTPEKPGLVLGLEPGGSCRGVAFRIPATDAPSALAALWKREMDTGSYIPRWLTVHSHDRNAPAIRAIGFVMNRRDRSYAGGLDHVKLLETLRTARGQRGTSAEYLLSTVQCLADHGIHDRHLAELADEVGLALFNPVNIAV